MNAAGGRGGGVAHSKFLDYAEIVGEEYKKLRLDSGQRELKNRLDILLSKLENQICADCGRKGPRWANTHLGLFFCIDCSTAHRSLKVKKKEKSQNVIKSVHRDVWTPSQVESMERLGNKKGNEYYEAALPALSPEKCTGIKPKETDSPDLKAKYIQEKYQLKLFTPENIEELLASASSTPQEQQQKDEIPVVPQDVLDILQNSKQHKEKTDLEKLLQERFDQYEEEIKEQKERKKRELWNRERIEEVKNQTTELYRLNIMRSILEKKKLLANEKNEKISKDRQKELEERRERLERRKEQLAESERRRWEAMRKAAQREAEKDHERKLLLGRDVGENPYSKKLVQIP